MRVHAEWIDGVIATQVHRRQRGIRGRLADTRILAQAEIIVVREAHKGTSPLLDISLKLVERLEINLLERGD